MYDFAHYVCFHFPRTFRLMRREAPFFGNVAHYRVGEGGDGVLFDGDWREEVWEGRKAGRVKEEV